jgi:hypothetical protein
MHSHNDPGWQMTYEEYFKMKTKNILDTVVTSLSEVLLLDSMILVQ